MAPYFSSSSSSGGASSNNYSSRPRYTGSGFSSGSDNSRNSNGGSRVPSDSSYSSAGLYSSYHNEWASSPTRLASSVNSSRCWVKKKLGWDLKNWDRGGKEIILVQVIVSFLSVYSVNIFSLVFLRTI